MEFTIPDRFHHRIGPQSDRVYSFGINSAGNKFTEDYFIRGDIMHNDITSCILPTLEAIRNAGVPYVVFETMNHDINLFATEKIDDEYLIEIYALSRLVDILEHVYAIRKKDVLSRQVDQMRIFLWGINGLNNWNLTNGLIDTKNKAFICRKNSRLSALDEFADLAYDPVSLIAHKCNVYKNAVTIKSEIADRANQMVHEYLKKIFFTD